MPEGFFAMGGYAPFVWTSYGLALVLLAGLFWVARRREHRRLQALRRRELKRNEQ